MFIQEYCIFNKIRLNQIYKINELKCNNKKQIIFHKCNDTYKYYRFIKT